MIRDFHIKNNSTPKLGKMSIVVKQDENLEECKEI